MPGVERMVINGLITSCLSGSHSARQSLTEIIDPQFHIVSFLTAPNTQCAHLFIYTLLY